MIRIPDDPKMVCIRRIEPFKYEEFEFHLHINGTQPGLLLVNAEHLLVRSSAGELAPLKWLFAFTAAHLRLRDRRTFWLIMDNFANDDLSFTTVIALQRAANELLELSDAVLDDGERRQIRMAVTLLRALKSTAQGRPE